MSGSKKDEKGAPEGSVDLRVVVIEDDPRYRTGLEQFLQHAPGVALAGSYGAPAPALRSAEESLRREGALPWDVALMDIEMPDMSGIEATRRLKSLAPELKVLMLTVFEQPGTIVEAICAGADGYLLKKTRAPDLLAGIRATMAGGSSLTPDVARRVLDIVRRSPPAGTRGDAPTRLDLTDREQDVLRALVDGMSYQQAADSLGIGLGTVRNHVTSIYRKLQVHSVAEAVSRAIREGLV